MSVVESGAFSGEFSFFPGTAGITPLALRLLLEMSIKKHRQGISQSQQFLKRNQTTVHFAETRCHTQGSLRG